MINDLEALGLRCGGLTRGIDRNWSNRLRENATRSRSSMEIDLIQTHAVVLPRSCSGALCAPMIRRSETAATKEIVTFLYAFVLVLVVFTTQVLQPFSQHFLTFFPPRLDFHLETAFFQYRGHLPSTCDALSMNENPAIAILRFADNHGHMLARHSRISHRPMVEVVV